MRAKSLAASGEAIAEKKRQKQTRWSVERRGCSQFSLLAWTGAVPQFSASSVAPLLPFPPPRATSPAAPERFLPGERRDGSRGRRDASPLFRRFLRGGKGGRSRAGLTGDGGRGRGGGAGVHTDVDRRGGLLAHRAPLARRRAMPPLPRQGVYACDATAALFSWIHSTILFDMLSSVALIWETGLGRVLLLQTLKKKNQKPLVEALLKVKEGAPHFFSLFFFSLRRLSQEDCMHKWFDYY